MKNHKQFTELSIVNLLLFGLILYALFTQNYEMVFMGILMIGVSLVPLYLKAAHDVHIPAMFIYITIVFIFASVFLGQFGGLYDRWHWYDAFLHFISAMVFGFIGFLLFYVYYAHNKLKFPRSLMLFFALFFVLGVGGLWEIIEYGIDNFFGTNMQVGSLDDTMIDLIVDGLGGLVSIIICSLYLSKITVPVIDKVVEVVTEEVLEENRDMARAASSQI